MNITRALAALAAAVLTLAPGLFVERAHAIDSCKVAMDRKTGLLTMSATNLTGLFGWRDSADDTIQAFDMANCVIDGNDVVKCPLAEAADKRATVPPPSCSVCIDDGSGAPCCARLKGCTPGMRDCTRVFASDIVSAVSYGEAQADCPIGYRVTGGGISHSDPFDLKDISTSRPLPTGKGWFCQGFNESAPFDSVLGCYAECCRMP